MTPEQRGALEVLVGRALTEQEVATIDPLLDGNNRRDDLIASLLSVGRTEVYSRMTSARGLAELYPGGPAGAEVILMKLEGAAAALKASPDQALKVQGSLIARQLSFLNADGLDFGSAALRGMLDQFVPSPLTEEEVTGLKAVATRPAPISIDAVSRALNIAEGRMVL